MLWINNQLADHGLNDSYIAIERAAYEATKESHPEVHAKANDKERRNGTKAAKDEDWLTTQAV